MSRSGYNEDCWGWELIMWRGAVASAMRGKRGQAFLKEMLNALDKIESKRLIAHELAAGGEVCAIGAVGVTRGIDMSKLDPEDRESVGRVFGIAPALAAELVFENDQDFSWGDEETPEARYARMHRWVESQILKTA